MFSRRSLISLSLLSALLATPAFAQVAMPAGSTKDVLRLVPEDAWGFAVARSLKTVDEKAVLLKETLGLPIPAPVTPMVLGMLNVGEALDMTRPICMVVSDVQKSGGFDNAVVMLVPATNPKALLESLSAPTPPEGAAAEPLPEGISKCMIMGKPGYATTKEKYLIVGPNHECVTKVAKAKKTVGEDFDKARLTAIGKSDLYISVSLSAIVQAYKDTIMSFAQMVTVASSGDPEDKSMELLVKMFSEMAAVDVSLSFDKDGLSLAILTAPKKDSDLEKLFRDTKNSGKALLSVLPEEKYLLAAAGTSNYSEHSEKFSGPDQLASMLKRLQIEGLNEESLKTLESGLKRLAKSTDAWAMSLSALPSGPEGMVGLAIVIEADDAEEYVANIRKMYKTVWAVSDDEDFKTVKENVVHEADAETIGGKKIDTVTVNLEELADLLDLNEEDLAEVNKVVGKDFVLRFGPADKKHVVVTFGGGKKRFETICGATESGSGLSANVGISKIASRLPSPRAAEVFIAIDNLGQLLKDVAKTLGEEEEFPFDVPTINAPVAISTVQLGSVQQMDIVVPMKLITSVKEFVDKQMSAGFEDFDEDEDEEGDEDEGDEEDEDEDEDEEDDQDED